MIQDLSVKYSLSPAFFADHERGSTLFDSSPWEHVFGTTPLARQRIVPHAVDLTDTQLEHWIAAETWVRLTGHDVAPQPDRHLIPRATLMDKEYGLNVLSRISVWSSHNDSIHLCTFHHGIDIMIANRSKDVLLVDNEVPLANSSIAFAQPRLHLPLSRNWGGASLSSFIWHANIFSARLFAEIPFTYMAFQRSIFPFKGVDGSVQLHISAGGVDMAVQCSTFGKDYKAGSF